ncbi:MAG TPA: sensor histidine kinase [Patescibacteria group bacterium]|nr:sensor histidine kinase [Patescibacteria group bacterium]
MNKLRVFNSLRVKLGIIAIVLIAIPLIALSLTYSRTVKEIIKNKYTETAIQSVFETGEKLNFILNDIREFSTVINSNSELLYMLNHKTDYRADEFGRVLRNFITSRDDIEVIDLVLEDAYYTVGAKKINRLERVNKRLEESLGQPLWLPTKSEEIEILSGKFKKNYFTLSRKIVDFNTLENYGYLLIDLEEVILEQAYSGLLDNEKAEVFICDNQGNIISHTDKNKIGGSIKNEPFAKEVLADKNGHNYVQYKTTIGKVAIYSTIENNGWKIIKTISTDYLYEEINRIQKYLVVGGIIYALAIILYILFFSFRYTEPMMKMMSVIKKVEQGDLTARTEVQSNDEVGQLGHSLNNMIGEMQVLIDQLIREEKEKKEVELEALHAQINPHFLYNTLNTIKWMAKIEGNSGVSKAITALVKLLRISTNLGRDMISLREEIDYVMNYLVIQKLRFSKAINIVYDIDENCMNLTLPKLILQPIVENSIIYGMEDEQHELNIEIRASIKEQQLIIEIYDDGPGIEDEILKNILTKDSNKNRFSKVGLNNVNQRIKLYCGSEFGLEVETELGTGTKVVVTLPAKPM